MLSLLFNINQTSNKFFETPRINDMLCEQKIGAFGGLWNKKYMANKDKVFNTITTVP